MSPAPEADRLRSIIAVAGEIAATRPEPDARGRRRRRGLRAA
jgi:hypothetical protein